MRKAWRLSPQMREQGTALEARAKQACGCSSSFMPLSHTRAHPHAFIFYTRHIFPPAHLFMSYFSCLSSSQPSQQTGRQAASNRHTHTTTQTQVHHANVLTVKSPPPRFFQEKSHTHNASKASKTLTMHSLYDTPTLHTYTDSKTKHLLSPGQEPDGYRRRACCCHEQHKGCASIIISISTETRRRCCRRSRSNKNRQQQWERW